MPLADRGWTITPEELRSWIISENDNVLAIDKPGLVVCHPSKQGPWSSLIGACREYLGVDRLHMPSRLDRETSGVVVFAKNRATASLLQKAVQLRQVRKTYYAVLSGELTDRREVDQPLGHDVDAEFVSKQCVVNDGSPAITIFDPITCGGGYTLARVLPLTGRTHQIRVHASWLGFPIAGDKLYGPDPGLMLEFVTYGFTPRLEAALPLPRHALHAGEVTFELERSREVFRAPLAKDIVAFCQNKMELPPNSELGN